jgi:aryl-alcohol dehydrogenase-like predicted oxidoreductase
MIIKLGSQTVNIASVALGTSEYGKGFYENFSSIKNDEDKIHKLVELIKAAQENLEGDAKLVLDTADMYLSESIIREALKKCEIKKEDIIIATKCGVVRDEKGAFKGIDCSPKHIYTACAASLKQLGTNYIDLLYLHFPSEDIKASIDALIKLKEEGKIKEFGLSNFTAEQIRDAYEYAKSKGHTPAAVQIEYSLAHHLQDKEDVIKLCQQLGITVFAHSPLAKGFFSDEMKKRVQEEFIPYLKEKTAHPTGYKKKSRYGESDQRNGFSFFNRKNMVNNIESENYKNLEKYAKEINVSLSMLALMFITSQGIIPIVGTTKPEHLQSAFAASKQSLSPEILATLTTIKFEGNTAAMNFNKLNIALTSPFLKAENNNKNSISPFTL